MSAVIRIESLIPQPLPDLKRVSLLLRVSGLPSYGPGAVSNLFLFSDMPEPGEEVGETRPDLSPPAPNVDLFLETPTSNQPPTGDLPETGEDPQPSPYPDISLSILDPNGNQIISTYIVEHKEPELDFTLHLHVAEPGATYTACAVMTMNDEVIQSVQAPFELSSAK
jgi:hypothetical protein